MSGLHKVSIPHPGWEKEFTDRYGNLIYNDYISQFRGLNLEEIKLKLMGLPEVRKAKNRLSPEQFKKELEKQANYIEKEHKRALKKVSKRREEELLKTLNKDREIIAEASLPRPRGTIVVSPAKRLGYTNLTFSRSKGTKRKKRISKKSKRGKKTKGRKRRRKSQIKPKKKRKTKRE